MEKQNIIMQLATGIALLSFLLLSPQALAQEDGKIYQLSYSPAEPVILEDLSISIGVENPSDKTHNYLIEFQIIEEGKIVHEQKFTFTLEKTKGISFTPKYTPQILGEHQVVAKLYDKFKVDLFDTKIMSFNAVSHLGPFDITIEPLTTRVRPGLILPAKVFLENMGTRGLDVEVRVSVTCSDKTLTQSLTAFVPARNQIEKLVSVQTCEQEGLYDILASILVFNKTWVSSSSQFFVNSSYIQLQFEVPEKIILKQGESYTLPVEVTNLGNQKIHDLQSVIQRIPLAWQKTSPSSIIEVEPNETVVFIVSIEVPKDAEVRTYEPRMTATAEEVLERKIFMFEVTPLATLPTATTAVFPIVRYIVIFVSSIVGLIIGGSMMKKYIKSKPKVQVMQPERVEILKKIKERIKSK